MRAISATHTILFDLLIFSTWIGAIVLGFHNSAIPPHVRYLEHEILSLGVIVLIFVHVFWHRQWLMRSFKTVTVDTVGKRTDLILAIVLFALFLAQYLSGVLIADLFGNLAIEQKWLTGIHHLTSKLSIIVVAIHLFRKRKWLGSSVQKLRTSMTRSSQMPERSSIAHKTSEPVES